MLIDFSVRNFRSIKETVTLSMVAQRSHARAGGRKGLRTDEEISQTFPGPSRKFDLLPVVGIFGPNASGKSTVLLALDSLISFVRRDQNKIGSVDRFFIPFSLDADSENQPTSFMIRALINETIYEYRLETEQERIVHESLRFLPPLGRSSRIVFEADWNTEQEEYVWTSSAQSGLARAHNALREHWRGRDSFLRIFVSFEAKSVDPFVDWLLGSWPGTGMGERTEHLDTFLSLVYADTASDVRGRVVEMMRLADTGLDNLEIRQYKGEFGTEARLMAVHEANGRKISWPFSHESYGTQALFSLFTKVVTSLDQGSCAIVDELGANVHRSLTHKIVELYKSKETNPKGAQLIFASHDATLMDDQFLRRDQIWFTEKQSDGSTNLYPLTDFHPRNDLDLYRGYIDGRFGAVPLLPILVYMHSGRMGSQIEEEPAGTAAR